MTAVEVFAGLLLMAIPLVGIARRWHVPYPIVLVAGGLVLGFIPLIPPIELDPQFVLLLFLPPLLYWESITAPTDEMRANARRIWSLAIGLVIVTTAAVAGVAHVLVPAMGWAAAFVFGAIVAPTDELAVVPILERFGVPRHTIAIIEGESLLNDAGSLVIYATAVGAVVTGTFSWAQASLAFVGAAVGAFAIGLVAALLAIAGWRTFTDTRLQAVISVLLPFVAYIPAQRLGLSGVLAVVVAGVVANRATPSVLTPSARLQLVGWWETTVFLTNAVIFILVGTSLHDVVAQALAHHHPWPQLLLLALAVNATIVAVRVAWVFGGGLLPQRRGARADRDAWKHRVIVAFSGFRGGVSLAAALAIPALTAAQQRFPERDLIIFVTFSVILVTLLGGGLAMPAVARALRIDGDETEGDEVRHALRAMSEAALRRLDELERDGKVESGYAGSLREFYRERLGQASSRPDDERRALQRYAIKRDLVEVERATLIAMRKRGEVDNKVLRRLQLTLDMAETELERMAGDADDIGEEESELGTSPPPAVTSPPAPRDRRAAP